MTRTPEAAVRDLIVKWEGEWQDDEADNGNWLEMPDGSRKLVGTMRGVTAAAFCNWFHVTPAECTPDSMQSLVTLDVATEIGVVKYYKGMHIDKLEWEACAEVVLDYAWGSGYMGLMRVQRFLGFSGKGLDGIIGVNTATRFKKYLADNGTERMLRHLCETRIAHYQSIVANNPSQERWINGWNRRARGFLPESEWYKFNWSKEA